MNFLSTSYWFNTPSAFNEGLYYYLAVAILLLIFAMISRYFFQKNKKNVVYNNYLKPLPSGFFWFSFTTFLFAWLRYEKMYIFSSRVWILVISACFIWWALPKVLAYRKNFQNDLAKNNEEKIDNKYHPKSTKKKKKKR